MEDNKTRRVVPKTEARERLGGISLTTLNQLVKNGELISVKIGRRSMVLVSSQPGQDHRGGEVTATAPAKCRHCEKNTADAGDGFCTPCRAKNACTGLTKDITSALESFLNARWAPTRHGDPNAEFCFSTPRSICTMAS
jgi:hypothetical protein